MPEVLMPDGSIVQMPDNISDSQKDAIKSKLQVLALRQSRAALMAKMQPEIDQYKSRPLLAKGMKKPDLSGLDAIDDGIREHESILARKMAEQGGLVDKALYYGKQGLSAIGRGLASLPALAAEAGNAEWRYAPANEPGAALSDAGKVGMQPTTPLEKYTLGAVEGATGAALGGGPMASKLATGAISNLAMQGSNQITGGNPLVAALSALSVGGAANGLAAALKTTKGDLVRQATQGVSADELQAAKLAQQRALLVSPVGINAAQALGRGSPLDSLVAALNNSKHGNMVRQQLGQQPEQALIAVEEKLRQLPGLTQPVSQAANNLQDAATSSIEALKKQRSDLWKSTFQENSLGQSRISPQAHSDVIKRIEASASQFPNTGRADFLKRIRDALYLEPGKPMLNAEQINSVLTEKAHTLKRPTLGTDGFDAGTTKWLGSQIQQIRDDLGDAFEPYRKANEAFSRNTQQVIDPAKKSILGTIAKGGSRPDQAANPSAMMAVFDEGTLPGSPISNILSLEKQLRSQPGGPQAFQDAFKSWVSTKVQGAAKSSTNRDQDNIPAALTKVFGKLDARTSSGQGLHDSLVATARAQGLAPKALLDGWKNTLDFVSAAAVRPGRSVMTGDIQEAAAGATMRNTSMNVTPVIGEVMRKMADLRGANAYQFLDGLLTTPEGTETLIKMSKSPSLSRGAAAALSSFMGGVHTLDAKQQGEQ